MKTLLKKSIFTILTVTISLAASAQSEVFKVLASRGKITLGDGSAIFAGKKLNPNDVIKVSDNSYLGLIHNTGKTLEIKEAGTYKVAELSSKVLAKNSSITKKYSDYVVGELTKADSKESYQKNMKVTGSVERGLYDIKLCLPKTSSIIETQQLVVWNKNPRAKSYTVQILDMFDEVKLSKEVTDTTFTLDINSIKVPNDKTLIILVTANGDMTSDKFLLKTMVEAKNPDIFADKNALAKEYSQESALGHLMKASFYAQNNLFLEAKKSYEAAIKLEPGVEEYKNAYKNFLAKNNLLEFYPYSK